MENVEKRRKIQTIFQLEAQNISMFQDSFYLQRDERYKHV